MKQAKDLTAQPEDPKEPFYLEDWKQIDSFDDGVNLFQVYAIASDGENIIKVEWWETVLVTKLKSTFFTLDKVNALQIIRNLKNTL